MVFKYSLLPHIRFDIGFIVLLAFELMVIWWASWEVLSLGGDDALSCSQIEVRVTLY